MLSLILELESFNETKWLGIREIQNVLLYALHEIHCHKMQKLDKFKQNKDINEATSHDDYITSVRLRQAIIAIKQLNRVTCWCTMLVN